MLTDLAMVYACCLFPALYMVRTLVSCGPMASRRFSAVSRAVSPLEEALSLLCEEPADGLLLVLPPHPAASSEMRAAAVTARVNGRRCQLGAVIGDPPGD
ncbi:MAG TPA: hypothetical protein DHU96_32590 [Actinobacteria bacterium]|nr:hypothetical protein [Actinomycetota bacterium]